MVDRRVFMSALLVVFVHAFSFAQTYSQFGSFPGEKLQSISCDDSFLFVGTDKGFYRSKAGVPNWKKIVAGNCRSVTVGDSLIAACCDSAIYVSYGNAATMEKTFTFNKNEIPQAVAAWESFIWVGTNNGVYLVDPTSNSCDTLLDSTNVNKVFVVDTFFFIGTQDGFYYTTPGDSVWEDLVVDAPFSALEGNDSMVVAAGDSGIWNATEKNGTWTATPMDSFPSDSLPTAIVSDSQKCFVATDRDGMYWFDNNASKFHRVNLPSGDTVSAMTICNDQLFLGTSTGLIWTSSIHDVPVTSPLLKTQASPATGLSLAATHSGIKLDLRWPLAERLEIAIVDCKGCVVSRSWAEQKYRGTSLFEIPLKLSAGAYAVTVRGKKYSVSSKISLQ